MPADRTRARGSKRGTVNVQLTWTPPVDAKLQSIAFAPNVTPGTYNDPPSPVDPPAESMLFPPTNESSPAPTGRRSGHTKKKPENHIPRPPNAFILFRSSFIKNQHVSSDVETNHSTLSKIIGLTWQRLPHEERQIWHSKAKVAQEEHRRKYPDYAFRPLHTKGKGNGEKRKVREVGPKDLKRCDRIAELLVEGLKGPKLEVAMAEFDKHHVPQIITRFEAPITARAYRRSSSAPVPDTEHSKPTFLSASKSTKKPRASSSEPDSTASVAYSDCQSPASSQGDIENFSEYYCDSPVSPSVAIPHTLVDNSPSLFESFSFTASPAPPVDSCDPLFNSSQDSVFDGYAPEVTSPCPSHGDVFDPSGLTIDTSFFTPMTASSSPFSSMPGTPLPYQCLPSCSPLVASDMGGMPALLDTSFDFFDIPNYSNGIPPMTAPQVAPEYFATAKADYSQYYEKSGFAPLNPGYPQSYMSPIPPYGM